MKINKILIVCLIIMFTLFINFSFIFAANSTVVSPKDAEMAARTFLAGRTTIDAELNNARVSSIEKFYDLSNDLIAYVFTIEKEKKK